MKPNFRIKNVGLVHLLAATVLISAAAFLPASVFADSKSNTAKVEPVEQRIKELHDKLKITAEEEQLWTKVTAEMRDQATSAQHMIGTRNDNSTKMTAVEDLKSYADIAQFHADGMKKFLDVFTPLYQAMSDDQKKNADDVFRKHTDTHRKDHQTALNKG